MFSEMQTSRSTKNFSAQAQQLKQLVEKAGAVMIGAGGIKYVCPNYKFSSLFNRLFRLEKAAFSYNFRLALTLPILA